MFTCNNLIENYKLYKTYPTLQMAKSDADSKSLIGIINFIYNKQLHFQNFEYVPSHNTHYRKSINTFQI